MNSTPIFNLTIKHFGLKPRTFIISIEDQVCSHDKSLLRLTSKKTSKLRTTGPYVVNPPMDSPRKRLPDRKVHGVNMGPTWVLSAPGGSHVGHMNLAIWVSLVENIAMSSRHHGRSDMSERPLPSVEQIVMISAVHRVDGLMSIPWRMWLYHVYFSYTPMWPCRILLVFCWFISQNCIYLVRPLSQESHSTTCDLERVHAMFSGLYITSSMLSHRQ